MAEEFSADLVLNGVNNASEVFDQVQGSGNKLKEFLGGLGSGAMAELKEQAGSLASEGFGKLKDGLGSFVSGAIAGLPGMLKDTIDKTAQWAERLDGLGDVLGTSGEESAGLIVAIQGVGGNAEAMSGQMVKMVKGLTNAKGELGPTGKILDELGVSFKDTNGHMLSSAEILQNVANKVGVMPDGLEKTTLMTQLFGKSGKDLSDVMGALSNDGLTKATAKAKDMGLALSDDVIGQSINTGREMNKLTMTLQGIVTTIGAQLVPAIAPLITAFAGMASQIVSALMPAVQPLVKLLGDLVTAVMPYVTIGINAIINVVKLAATAFSEFVSGAGPGLSNVFGTIKTAAEALFSGFQGKSFAEMLGLDPEIAGLIVDILGQIAKPFQEFGAWIQENWPLIKQTFQTVMQALKPIVDAVLPPLAIIFKTTFGIIVDNIKSSIQIILGIIKGLMQMMNGDISGGLQTIFDAFKGKFTKIGEFLGEIKTAFGNIATSIIDTLYNGIVNGAGKVWDAIKNLVMGPIGDIANKIGLPGLFSGQHVQGGAGASAATATDTATTTGFATSVAGNYGGGSMIIQLLLGEDKLAEAVINGRSGTALLLHNARRVF